MKNIWRQDTFHKCLLVHRAFFHLYILFLGCFAWLTVHNNPYSSYIGPLSSTSFWNRSFYILSPFKTTFLLKTFSSELLPTINRRYGGWSVVLAASDDCIQTSFLLVIIQSKDDSFIVALRFTFSKILHTFSSVLWFLASHSVFLHAMNQFSL